MILEGFRNSAYPISIEAGYLPAALRSVTSRAAEQGSVSFGFICFRFVPISLAPMPIIPKDLARQRIDQSLEIETGNRTPAP